MIRNHLSEVKINLRNCNDIGKSFLYKPLCAHPFKDLMVMVTAADMLMKSLEP